MFDISLYNDEFFDWHLKYARSYQLVTFMWYLSEYKPASVIDFGCGIGSYLEAAKANGITRLKGIDISDAARAYTPESVRDYIEYKDCTLPIEVGQYDCVLSFETAEHIDPAGTDQFITNIKNAASKYILFTAAPPGQDGCGHINMHPREWWVDKFGLNVDEAMTRNVSTEWFNLGCPSYISGNLIIFKK